MRYFDLISEGIDVAPLRHAVVRQPELWNVHRLRTTHPGSVHGEADDIWLRFAPVDSLVAIVDGLESIDYPALATLSQARPIIFDLMRRVEGIRLGRVLITRLRPGGRVRPHEDAGGYAAYYDRYHICLQGAAENFFHAGDERVAMRTGEVWWFDNAKRHQAVNSSASDRIHMIVDIRS
jgi:hypothetical protein